MAESPRHQVKAGIALVVIGPIMVLRHVLKAMPTFFLVAGLMWLGWLLLDLLL